MSVRIENDNNKNSFYNASQIGQSGYFLDM